MSDNTDPAAEREAAVVRVAAASRAERVLSQVGWWTPEIAGATAVGGAGAVVVHPMAAVVAAAVLGVRIGWAQVRSRRSTSTDADPASTSTAAEDAEGVEGVA